MKRYISAILIPCLLLQLFGCYSSLASGEDIHDYLKSGNELKFKLKNHNSIIAKSDDCRLITEPIYFIHGKGILIDKKIKDSKNFLGEIKQESIDSVKIILVDSKKYFVYWLKDSTRISFKENEVVNITPETTSDFWLIRQKDADLYTIVYANDIDEIKIEDRTANIALAVIGGVLAVALLVTALIIASEASNL